MSYSSPTTDIAFKKLFGSQKHTKLTISFLNNILDKKEGELITNVTINDNANLPIIGDKKVSFVDVSCTDQSGKHYVVEMQVDDQRDFLERAQFYTACRLARQLNKRDQYKDLVPVIFVAILDFNLFNTPDYLTHHLIMNAKTKKQTMFHQEFHFIELKKFTKELDQISTMTDHWIYLIKQADQMKQIPRQMQNIPEMVEALDLLQQDSWTKAELEAYQIELDRWRVEKSIAETAQEKAKAKGRAQGIEEGLAEGKIEGKIEGEKTKALEIAQEMLTEGYDINKIARITKLSPEDIKKLQKR